MENNKLPNSNDNNVSVSGRVNKVNNANSYTIGGNDNNTFFL